MTAMRDDAELLRCYVRDRSNPAFADLVQRHIGLVYSVALRRVGGDTHMAEDVTQKVFCDLARKAASLTSRATLSSWLYVSAHVASAAVVRSEQRRKRREIEAHAMETTLSHPRTIDTNETWRDLQPMLDDLILELKEEEREAVVLRFFAHRSFADIGAALSVSEDTARKRLDRTLEKLRAIFARRGVTSTATALGLALTALGTSVVPVGLSAKIAGSAFAHAAATSGSASPLLAALKSIAPAAAIIGGGLFFIHAQQQTNQALSAELKHLEEMNRGVTVLRDDNRRLARVATEIAGLRQAQQDLPALRARLAGSSTPAAPAAPAANAVVALTSAGVISWDQDYVSLREFLERLQALQARGSEGARIIFRIDANASASAIGYVVEEATKAQVALRMIPDGPIARSTAGSWF